MAYICAENQDKESFYSSAPRVSVLPQFPFQSIYALNPNSFPKRHCDTKLCICCLSYNVDFSVDYKQET